MEAGRMDAVPVSYGWKLAGRMRFLSVTDGSWQEGRGSCQLRMEAGRKDAVPVSYGWKLAGRTRFLSVTDGSWQGGRASCHGLVGEREPLGIALRWFRLVPGATIRSSSSTSSSISAFSILMRPTSSAHRKWHAGWTSHRRTADSC